MSKTDLNKILHCDFFTEYRTQKEKQKRITENG